MKEDIELDSLLEEYQNLMNPREEDFNIAREDAMFLAMSDKYGRKPESRDVTIDALRRSIEEKKLKVKG